MTNDPVNRSSWVYFLYFPNYIPIVVVSNYPQAFRVSQIIVEQVLYFQKYIFLFFGNFISFVTNYTSYSQTIISYLFSVQYSVSSILRSTPYILSIKQTNQHSPYLTESPIYSSQKELSLLFDHSSHVLRKWKVQHGYTRNLLSTLSKITIVTIRIPV